VYFREPITPQTKGGTVIAQPVSMNEEKHMEHMDNKSVVQRVGAGAAAGIAGTVLIQGLMAASQKWAPESLPPIRQDPGEFMVRKAGELLPEKVGEKIPEELETAAAKLLGLGYGATFGALYASSRPEVQKLLLEGSVLGLATWAAGYLGWLPAAGLMPRISEQEPKQIAGPILSHILFGIVTVGLYRLMRERW
jgi:pimeloyl-ACP methyl ester carboxylesterase